MTDDTPTMTANGRSDYRRGVEFNPHAYASWKAEWLDEAHLTAQALQVSSQQELALAMAGIRALSALEAAQRVLSQCTSSKLSRRQQQIIGEAGPLLADAIARLRPAARPEECITNPG